MRAAKTAQPRMVQLPFREWLKKRPSPATGKTEPRSNSGWKSAILFGFLFFIGYLAGIGQGRTGNSSFGLALADYYTDPVHFERFSALFLNLYSAAFLQAVLVLVCGFSALGSLFLGMYFVARGLILGLCASTVFVSDGTRGLVVHWMLTCLPDMGIFLAMLWLSVQANRCAGFLFRGIVNTSSHLRTTLPIKALAGRFAAALMLAAGFCLLGAASGVLFAGVLL